MCDTNPSSLYWLVTGAAAEDGETQQLSINDLSTLLPTFLKPYPRRASGLARQERDIFIRKVILEPAKLCVHRYDCSVNEGVTKMCTLDTLSF